MISEARGRIDYEESGQGPTLVLVPGSCSAGAAWRPMMARWGSSFRCVTTSLLGYGGTAERRTGLQPDIAHEAEIVEAVIRRAGGPVHLVGHSFGGLVAVAVAARKKVALESLVVVEAPAAELLHHAGEHKPYRAFRDMTGAYFTAFHAGNSGAIETMIDFYGGAGTFASWPQRVRDYAIETTPVNLLDWADAYRFALTPALLGQLDVPALVLWGGASQPAVQRANQLLGRYIRHASAFPVPGAAHFMISTHAEQVAELVARHVAHAERGSNFAFLRAS